MWNAVLRLIDWFVPEAAKRERSELGLARNFVFTHLFGPLMAQSICLFLYLTTGASGASLASDVIQPLKIYTPWQIAFAYVLARVLRPLS